MFAFGRADKVPVNLQQRERLTRAHVAHRTATGAGAGEGVGAGKGVGAGAGTS